MGPKQWSVARERPAGWPRPRRRSARRLFAKALIVGMVAAWISLQTAILTRGAPVLLPGNAILLGLILVRARDRRGAAAVIFGGGVGSLLGLLHHGPPLGAALLFVGAGMAEIAIAATLLHRWQATRGGFEDFRSVGALLVACALAPLASSLVSGAALAELRGLPFWTSCLGWYAGAALSLALVTPAVVIGLALADGGRPASIAVRRVGEVMAILALVAVVAGAVFLSTGRPLLFLILPFVLLATFRLRQVGAVAATAIVTVVAVQATLDGLGPIALAGADAGGQYLFLQFFLAVTFLSALPVAAALAERDARAEEAHMIADHFKAVVENASEVIFRTDAAGRWTYLNPAWEALTGYSHAESLGRPITAWVEGEEQAKLAEWAAPVFAGEVRATRRMLRFRTGGGAVRWMELAIQALADQDGKPIGATGTLRDIDDRKRLEEHVLTAKRRAEERARAATLLASTDELTGLANRRAFLRHLDRQTEAATEFGWRLTVAMLDVDHFKRVNDRFGHAVGDEVLRRVAQRASTVCRAGDLIGRLGGEEFGILMPSAGTEDARQVAERLREAIETPLPHEAGPELPGVTVSIGIATRTANQTGAEVLAQADSALYAAKEAGRNRVKIAA